MSLLLVLAGCSEGASPAAPVPTTGAGGNGHGGHSTSGGSGGAGGSGTAPSDCGFTERAPARIDIAERVGHMMPAGYASVDARLADKPWPSQYAVVAEAGYCRYLEADYEPCDPPCDSGELCAVGGTCAPLPQTLLIPAAVVDPLPSSATPPGPCTNSSCPPSQLTRFRRGTAPVPAGEAELIVRHTVQFAYAHTPE